MQNIAVFCGSKFGNNPKYKNEVLALGAFLGAQKKHIIYGGGDAGLMGTIANSALQNGATVTGIIPAFLNTQERMNINVTELIVTKTMHERKQLLFDKSDAAIILPGGFGTLDELFEILTWNQLELHKIKVIVFNIDGFYNHLLQHITHMNSDGFLYNNNDIIVANTVVEIQQHL